LNKIVPFHLAFPVRNIKETKDWYTNVLGCYVGRQSKKWIDLDFYGHQLSAHLSSDEMVYKNVNSVDGDSVPVFHFGLILDWDDWHILSNKLKSLEVKFIIKPRIRFKGRSGEQATMFLSDPSGNILEFKSFKDPNDIFKTDKQVY